MSDELWMRRALSLAGEAAGQASPNPLVGCVLVRGGEVLGEGAHYYARRDHAEIAALQQAGEARGASAYVTLEPCAHHGRTGPCAEALVAAGIARCVVATVDPNPQVSGQGIARLRAAGIHVDVGLCEREARALNNAFALSIVQRRPFVTLKSALSVDGRLAPEVRTPGQPYWLTGSEARAEVHRLRHASDVLLTGIGTVLADDPLLTDRSGLTRRRPLVRAVLDSHLRIPLDGTLVRSAQDDLLVFCSQDAPSDAQRTLEVAGVHVTRLARVTPKAVLEALYAATMTTVLLEAGPRLNGIFLREDFVDRAILFYAETELGPRSLPFTDDGPTSFALESRMLSVSKRTVGADVEVSGLLHDPWAGVPSFG